MTKTNVILQGKVKDGVTPHVTLGEQREGKGHKKRIKTVPIPTMKEALISFRELPQDIKVILDSGITRAALARSLGVTRPTVWRWEVGGHYPREPLILLVIITWADEIKQQQKEKEGKGKSVEIKTEVTYA